MQRSCEAKFFCYNSTAAAPNNFLALLLQVL